MSEPTRQQHKSKSQKSQKHKVYSSFWYRHQPLPANQAIMISASTLPNLFCCLFYLEFSCAHLIIIIIAVVVISRRSTISTTTTTASLSLSLAKSVWATIIRFYAVEWSEVWRRRANLFYNRATMPEKRRKTAQDVMSDVMLQCGTQDIRR